eukprot:TRINITY_DN43302_c0_g1_i1.p1 TRINITY_DN43302_c0_g1~~TRINITY_DN43302_c0_g1_i1.p1  ORF type:complete len:604 (-),score=87.24 TRINITY_DN43302_c0_g1_i1:271-2082(-)
MSQMVLESVANAGFVKAWAGVQSLRWRKVNLASVAAASAVIVISPRLYRWVREWIFPKGQPLPRRAPLQQKLRVAILGAGVGGSALACWLRDLYGDDLELTVVTDGPIGGRIQTVELGDGRQYEGGAAIISDMNEYMMGFMHRLGLKEKYFSGLDVPLGIFDGRKFLVREVDPACAWFGLRRLAQLQSVWRLVRRYGLMNLRRLKQLMNHKDAPRFPALYRLLREGQAFADPRALLTSLGSSCFALTQEQATKWLTLSPPGGGDLPENLVREIVTGGMRSNYGGQGCDDLHGFVGLVSIAGGFASRCFAIRQGNQQVPQGLLASARPDHLLVGSTARVVRRAASDKKAWEVEVDSGPNEAMKGTGSLPRRGESRVAGPFDVVVVAHPLERSCVRFEGIKKGSSVGDVNASHLSAGSDHAMSFRRCVTHFVRGVLKRSYFAESDDMAVRTSTHGPESPPLMILTVAGSTAPFYSIGLQLPVDVETLHEAKTIVDGALDGKVSVFKVFAPDKLSDAQLDEIFETREGTAVVLDWYAYPGYGVPQTFRPFILDGDEGSLFYLNAIEQVASAMEMSAIGARNVANLVVANVERRRRGSTGGTAAERS